MNLHHSQTRGARHLRLPRRLAATLAACALAAPAFADDFSGTGLVEATTPVEAFIQSFLATSNGGYTFAGSSGWNLYAPFTFNFALNTGSGSFGIGRGDDILAGTLTTRMASQGVFNLTYTVTHGAGLFAGASGGGGDTVVTLTEMISPDLFRYTEQGQITVVPEPASWAMLIGGSLLLAARRRQRA